MGKMYIGPKKLMLEVLNKIEQPIIEFENKSIEVIKEKIVYIEKPIIQIEEKIVHVIKEVFVDKPFEVIREVKVIEEKIVEVIKEVPVEVKVIEEKFVEIEKFIDREIHKIPTWMWGLVGCETLLVLILLLK